MTSDDWKVIRGLFIWLDPDDWVHSRAIAKAQAQERVHNEADVDDKSLRPVARPAAGEI